MKAVKKFKLNRKHILVISVALLLAVLIAAYVVVDTVIIAGSGEQNSGGNSGNTLPELMTGEAVYSGNAVAFPRLSQADITSIVVDNKKGAYALSRYKGTGDFWIYYDDGINENFALYSPGILAAEGDANYANYYANMVVDGISQGSMITYLCAAVGTLYFSERIELPPKDDESRREERDNLLREFGFTSDNAQFVNIEGNEKQSDGSTKKVEHILTIGDSAISGEGYYYMVDGRDYIYYHLNTYLEYALEGVETFIKGTVVGKGLDMDGTFEPYLTTDFKQWKNSLNNKLGTKITEDSFVVCTGTQMRPVNAGVGHVGESGESENGYIISSGQSLDFDLHSALKNHSDFERFKNYLVGKQVGTYYDPQNSTHTDSDKLYLTILSTLGESEVKMLPFRDGKDKAKYTYTVTEIESIITDTVEYGGSTFAANESELPVSVNNLISAGMIDSKDVSVKLGYIYSIDGEVKSGGIQHAVLDLSSPLLPEEAREAIANAEVGSLPLDSRIVFDVDYDKTNSISTKNYIVISSISSIVDSTGEVLEKVGAKSYVTFSYYEVKEGVKSSTYTRTVYLPDLATSSENASDNADERWFGLKALLIGKERANDAELVLHEEELYYEIMRDFVGYEIHEIKYTVTYEPVVSFRFVNASERDKYYGETYYENTLLDGNKLYGLNASACENVVMYLGGVGGDGTTVSQGFAGETVALGLTLENMEKYGLYANSIYFELPRGIIDVSEESEQDDEDELSNYEWFGTLGFNLYISDVKYDPDTSEPIRYIGSDMFDLVARVPAEDFYFLDMDFTDFWARQNLVMMDVNMLDAIEFDLNMEDMRGEYNFDMTHKVGYIYYKNGKPTLSTVYVDGSTAVDYHLVDVTAGEGSFDTELLKMMKELGYDALSLGEFYNKKYGYPDNYYVSGTLDSVGSSNFKTAFESLQLTRYQGTVTDEERAMAKDTDPIATMTLRMSDREKYYVYEFYRVADRKVMVSLYCVGGDNDEAVTDFYITTYAFKKIVDNFVGVLNGESLDLNSDYPGEYED